MTSSAPSTASTEIARPAGGSGLAITGDQDFWNDKQKAALAQIGIQNATNADLAVFFHQCTRTGLDPFLRQIYMIERQGKQTIQTGIDGFRLVARRAVDRTGETYEVADTLWCGEDGVWSDVWLGTEPPAAAKAVVIRGGVRFSAVALYNEYVARKSNGEVNSMWKSKPAHMIGKCAEALAHRKAFPQDLSGIVTDEEVGPTIEHNPDEPTPPRSGVARLANAITPPVAPTDIEPEPAADTSEAPPADENGEPPTDPQRRKLFALLNDFAVTSRPDRLRVLSAVVGREIGSSTELSQEDVSYLITVLDGLLQEPDPQDALAQLVAA